MALNLTTKKALVTGATDGLGRLVALSLAKAGLHLVVHGRNPEKAATVVEELKSINPNGEFSVLICDLNQPETIKEKFSQITELDILINNAGVWTEGNTIDTTNEKIIELTNVNLTSTMAITRTLIPVLLKPEFAQILNVISIAGVEIPFDYYHSIYSGTKYGLQGFTESLVKEFEDKNLRVMGFYPGGMNTGLFKKAGFDYAPDEPWMFDPQESADAVLFMLTRNPKVSIKRMDLINHLQQ